MLISNVPNSMKIESSLRKTIYDELKAKSIKNPKLNLSVSESYKDGSYSTVIAIENENISTINLNNNCLSTFSIGIQIITFNTKDQQIVSILPNAVRRIYYDEPINNSCNNIDRKINLIRFAELYYGLDISKKDYDKFISLNDEEIVKKIEEISFESKAFISQTK